MSDLKRLREWHLSEAQQWLDMFDTEQDSESPDEGSMHESGERWKNHRETARILSVLAAAREGCRVRYAPEATNAAGIALPAELEITGPAEPLRRLAELLGGGK